jgi:hypothetical protein
VTSSCDHPTLCGPTLGDAKSQCLCRYVYPFLRFIETFGSAHQQLSEGRGHTSATRPTVSASQLLGPGVWGQMASPCTPSNSHPAFHFLTASWYSCVINHSIMGPSNSRIETFTFNFVEYFGTDLFQHFIVIPPFKKIHCGGKLITVITKLSGIGHLPI